MSEEKQYAERDLMGMDEAGNHYCRHISAMTREGLDSKSDIAAELGWRDMQIAALQQKLEQAEGDAQVGLQLSERLARQLGEAQEALESEKRLSAMYKKMRGAAVAGHAQDLELLDALAAESAALKHGAEYFMYGPDCGFERFDSQDAAIKAANEMIDDYREDAADGWCDEVDQVCFGIVMSYARQHDVQQPSEDNGFLGSVNYMMSAPEAPATDAYLNSVRAEGVEMFAKYIALYNSNAKSHAKSFAAQLRAGKDGK
ncbi:hypothetical protein C3408_22660 [Candidatus Pantoea alvi]|nr:hypothetical protein C3408_22660 [Pantoea alvi]